MKTNQLNLLLFLSLCISFHVSSQQINLRSEEAKSYKEKNVIVISTGDSIADVILTKAVKDKWRFSDSVQCMELSASEEYVKKYPKSFVRLQLNLVQGDLVRTMTNGNYTTELSRKTYGKMLKLYIFEDEVFRKFSVGLQSNTEFSEEIIYELIQRSCGVIEAVEEMGTWNKLCLNKRENSQEMIHKKTLLVPLDFVKDLADTTKFKSCAPFKMQFVSTSFIQEKIIDSDDRYMYIIAVEEVVNYHMHFICTTENSDVLSVAARLTQGPGEFKDETKKMYIDLKTFKKLINNL